MLALLPLLLPFLPGLLPWPFVILASTPGLAAFGWPTLFQSDRATCVGIQLGSRHSLVRPQHSFSPSPR